MVTRVDFQKLADELINNVFGDFRDPVVLTQLGDFDYDLQTSTVIATDNTKGIRVEFNKNQVDGSKIQASDYQVLLVRQEITVDVRVDNVDMIFKGIAVTIEDHNLDAAEAVLTLHVREK